MLNCFDLFTRLSSRWQFPAAKKTLFRRLPLTSQPSDSFKIVPKRVEQGESVPADSLVAIHLDNGLGIIPPTRNRCGRPRGPHGSR